MGYWENRQARAMYESMESAEKVAERLADIYAKASRHLSYRIDGIYEKFRDKHHLTDKEAMTLLNTLRNKNDIAELRRALEGKNRTDTGYAELLAKLESQAYGARIGRLEQLQAEIDRMMKEVYKQEKQITTSHYKDLAQNAYYREIYNVQRQVGFQFSFSAVDPAKLERLLRSTWSGANYSARIWKNLQGLADDVKEQMLLGLLTGKSEREMAREIAGKYAAGAFEARRLVRTESNFVNGQMQLAAYEECDAEKYEFVAVLDLLTSEVCREMDGKVFSRKDAMPGVNMNPMHPFCRSTTIIHLDEGVVSGLKRRARDPDTGENRLVPASMNYKEWYSQNVAGNPQAQASEKILRNRAADRRQYEKYRGVIGKKAGKDVAAFQDMKYNNPDTWHGIQTEYKDTILRTKIRSDETNKMIHSGKQGKHIRGHNNYMEGRSYLTITEEQAQELVNMYAGTGSIIRDNKGKYTGKEKITVKEQVGVCRNLEGKETATGSFIIHYSKSGVHIVPKEEMK